MLALKNNMYDESNLKFATHNNLDKRCCDIADNCDNTQTFRELIHDLHIDIYGFDIEDSKLNEMSDNELADLYDDLDYLSYK